MSVPVSNLLKSSLISLAATFISLAAGFASSIIAARLLGPAGSGKVAYALWVATSAAALADMGLPHILLRNASGVTDNGNAWKALVRTALHSFLISVSMIGVAILLFAAITYAHRDASHAWFWLITGLLFLSYAFHVFSTAVARGRNRFGQTARTTLLGGALQVPLVFAGAWLLGPTGALIGYIARYLPQALKLRGYIDPAARSSREALSPEMLRYGRYIWFSDLIEILVLSRIEFLFLGAFLSPTSIGFFAAGLGLAGLIEQIMLQISPALVVNFTAAHAKGDRQSLEASYRRVIRTVALIMLPISMGGAIIMPELLPLIFGDAFEPAVPAAATLLAFVWLAGMSVIPWGIISASGRSATLLRVQITSAAATIVLLSILVPSFGLGCTSRNSIGEDSSCCHSLRGCSKPRRLHPRRAASTFERHSRRGNHLYVGNPLPTPDHPRRRANPDGNGRRKIAESIPPFRWQTARFPCTRLSRSVSFVCSSQGLLRNFIPGHDSIAESNRTPHRKRRIDLLPPRDLAFQSIGDAVRPGKRNEIR